MADQPAIRVLLVDDHQMVRQGLLYFLSAQEGIEVVGQAENGLQAVTMVEETRPDVVLMDLAMPEMDGLEALRRIKADHADIEVLVLTSFVDDEKVLAAIEHGASGYLMKDIKPGELARAIRAAARGEVYLHPEAARHLAQAQYPGASDREEPSPAILTEREREVLELVARGLSNQDIADTLTITLKTVKTHVSNILHKLGLESRVQAALYALRHNLVPFDEI